MILGIESIAHAFGANRIDNVEFGRQRGFDPGFIADKLGIETRYTTTKDQASSDLACAAVCALLEKTGISKAEIGFLALVTQTPDYQLPHTAALVQARLGLSQRLASFDISLGCSGFVYGLAAAASFMATQGIRHGILVTVDVYSKLIQTDDRATSTLFSDVAAATLIGDRPIYTLGRTIFGTDGAGASKLMVDSGGSREPGGNARLFMDGRAIFSFMMTRIPQDVEECLDVNGLEHSDVDRYVFHQANRFMIESLADRICLDRAKVVLNVRDGGNTVGSTIPIALESILGQHHRNILVSGFGVGLSWATGILKLNEVLNHE